MSLSCPKCGSRDLRFSRTRGTLERLKKIVGIRPFRCRDCHTRFIARWWSLSDLAYARCPKCWRMDLSRWDEKHFHPPRYMRLAVKAGANPYRCEYCRFNFVSFRRRKERFSFHRWSKIREQAGQPEQPVPAETAGKPEAAPKAPAGKPMPAPAVRTGPASPLDAPDQAPATAAEAIAWRKAAEERRRGSS